MSKKTLNESTIRRFMKLADINPLADSFIKEGGMHYQRDEEDAMADELPAEDPAMDMGEEPPMEEPMAEEPPMEEPAGPVDVKGLVDAIADAITQETGVEVTTAEEGEEMPEEPMGELPLEDEPMPDEEPMDLEGEEEPAAELEEEFDVVDDEEIMNEVYRRVVSRLTKLRK